MNMSPISEKLSSYPIETIEELHDFNLRSDAKVRLSNYLSGFFESISSGHSLRVWADHISGYLPEGVCVTKGGLHKRLGPRQLACVAAMLQHSLQSGLTDLHSQSLSSGWFQSFGKVYVEDSVCMKLNKALSESFPGSHSSKGPTSTARLQVRMNLQDLSYEHFSLHSYRANDQKYSGDIVPVLQAGDLVLRDLGYWSLEVFRQIMAKDAYVLSRYKPGVNLYEAGVSEALDLVEKLKQIERRGGNYWQSKVEVGKEARLPMRIVALKCSKEVKEKRVAKAQKDRHQKTNHDHTYYELLGWTIFLTNVPKEVWKPHEILLIYGFRWHIEMVFKVWKSQFELQKVLTKAQIKKANHLKIFIHLFLLYVLLFYTPYYRSYAYEIYQQHRRLLSGFLFAEFLKKNLHQLIDAQLKGQHQHIIRRLMQTALCEQRQLRKYQLEILFLIKKPKLMVLIEPNPHTTQP